MNRAIDRPIFIVGCGRSGTTLLYELLGEHPDLAWFSNLSQRAPRLPQLAALSRSYRLRRSSLRIAPRPAEGHRLWDACAERSAPAANAPLSADDLEPAEAQHLRRLVAAHLRFQGGERFLNKNTRNARRVAFLHALFPDTRVVHVVRDPRATAASLLHVAFWPTTPIWWSGDRTPTELVAGGWSRARLAGEFWTREVRQVLEDRHVLAEAAYTEVRYEDLVTDPLTAVGRVLEAVELRPSTRVFEAVERARIRDRSETFRHRLDPLQIREIEAVSGELASRLGYVLSES